MKDDTDNGLRLAGDLASNAVSAAYRIKRKARKRGLKKAEAYWDARCTAAQRLWLDILISRSKLHNPVTILKLHLRTKPRLP